MLYANKFKKIEFLELADLVKSIWVSQRVWRTVEKIAVVSLSADKSIIPHEAAEMVLDSSRDVVPLKYYIKNCRVSNLVVRIVWIRRTVPLNQISMASKMKSIFFKLNAVKR
jgi:hypothetical protein